MIEQESSPDKPISEMRGDFDVTQTNDCPLSETKLDKRTIEIPMFLFTCSKIDLIAANNSFQNTIQQTLKYTLVRDVIQMHMCTSVIQTHVRLMSLQMRE